VVGIARLLVLIWGVWCSEWVMALSFTHELTQEELQEKVSAMMPIENKTLFFTVKVFDPKIELKTDEDRIGVFIQIAISGLGNLQAAGRGKLSGSVSYNAEQKAFYLHDPIVESVEFDGLRPEHVEQAKQLMQIAISSTVLLTPIYRFDPNSDEHNFAKSKLQSVEVKEGVLRLTLNLF